MTWPLRTLKRLCSIYEAIKPCQSFRLLSLYCSAYPLVSNYEQLGLKFRLFSAEVLFNKGLAQIYMGRLEAGLQDMQEATRDKATDEHNVIDDAIQDRGEGYTVFSIVRGSLFPSLQFR